MERQYYHKLSIYKQVIFMRYTKAPTTPKTQFPEYSFNTILFLFYFYIFSMPAIMETKPF